MRAVIQDNKWVYFESLTTDEEDVLWEEFSVSDKNAYIDPNQMGMWDGVYRKYNRAKKRIARPLLSMLLEICERNDLVLSVVDRRPSWDYSPINPDDVGPDFLPGITLDPHQIEATKRACKIECGIVDVPTGGGKGEIICCFAKAIQCPTVIIADQTVVISQLKRRLELRDVAEEIGMFYAGRRPNDELIVVGSIQSLSPPTKPPDVPQKTSKETDEKFAKRLEKWDKQFQAYKTRRKNAKFLQQYVKKAEMIMVDECDRASSEQYKNLFRHYFSGRRRYGFCLSGKTIITTIDGESRLADSVGHVVLLSQDGTFRDGLVVETGKHEAYKLSLVNGKFLYGSADHLIACDDGCYVRFSDVIPGQFVQIENDSLINELEGLANFLSMNCASFDFGDITWSGFEFSRPNFKQEFIRGEINNILSDDPIEFVCDPGVLGSECNSIIVEKLHEQMLVGGCEVEEITRSCEVIPGFEFCRKFQSSTTIPFGQRITYFSSDFHAIDGVSAEFIEQSLDFIVNSVWHMETDGDTISFYHCPLYSIDQFLRLHRMINTISIDAGFSSFRLIIERLTTVSLSSNHSGGFLIFWNGKPIINAIFFEHFLLISFMCSFSDVLHMREIFNTIRTQMPSEFADLVSWAVYRALKNINTLITFYGNDVLVPRLAVIPFSLDDHDLSLSKGAPFYLCQKTAKVVTVEPTGIIEQMYDVVDVDKSANYVANSILVHNSGTPMDAEKPVQAMVMQEHLGSPFIKVSRRYLERIKRIIPCSYYMLAFGLDGDIKESSAYDIAYNSYIVENDEFHKLIVSICDKYKDDSTLILVDRVNLGEKLEELLGEAGHSTSFIYGGTGKRRRDVILRSFENKELNVLIGGKIINRGLDLSGGCDNLIIATGGKLESEFIQKVGRALRHNKRGHSRVFDFYFRCNKYLYNHSKARLTAMVNAGYETTVIFPGGRIDGAQLIKNRFRVPSKLYRR